MNRSRQDVLLGIVFFGGLATLLWATTALTDLSLQTRPQLQVLFRDVSGLRIGDQTYILGHHWGQVKEIRYQEGSLPDERIAVLLELDEELTLKSDADIKIMDASLLGAKRVEIDPGIADQDWPAGLPLRGRLQKNGIDALGDMVNSEDVQAIIDNLRSAVENLNSDESTIGKLLLDSVLYDELNATVQSARRSLEELEKGESTLGRLIYSNEMGATVDSAVTRIDSVAGKIDEGEGTLGMLVNDTETAENVKQAIESIRSVAVKVDTGDGTFGRLVNSTETADNMDAAIVNIRDTFEKANDPEAGILGALVADAELRGKFVSIVDDAEAIFTEAREGNGLLANLINNEEWTRSFDRILTQVSRAVEDAREAAPVGTFFQVLAGAF
ncbi:MAG: MlaD family protein [Planctomycetota bacterium]|jgi:phospholipid/cholesterol/gamma-HCH transport system substrate-binding protein